MHLSVCITFVAKILFLKEDIPTYTKAVLSFVFISSLLGVFEEYLILQYSPAKLIY